jgi:steroid delta-isomerase-like uncharacterized protein
VSVEANKVLLRRYWGELWDQRQFALLDELFTPTFVFHAPVVPGGVRGSEAFRQHVIVPLLTAFPDLKFTPGPAIAEGDRVAMEFTMSGTHQGPFEGVPPTGRTFSVPGISTSRITAGKIEELRGVFDGLFMMQQLGIMPTTH